MTSPKPGSVPATSWDREELALTRPPGELIEAFQDFHADIRRVVEVATAVARGFENVKSPVPDSKAPDWLHGLDLKVRKAGEEKFTDKTKKTSVEVYLDENNNNLIYITENGQIAVAAGKDE